MLHPLPFTMFDLSKGGNIGGVQDIGNNAMFTASVHNNRFDRNHYILGTNDKSCFLRWNENDGGKPGSVDFALLQRSQHLYRARHFS